MCNLRYVLYYMGYNLTEVKYYVTVIATLDIESTTCAIFTPWLEKSHVSHISTIIDSLLPFELDSFTISK